MENSRVNNNFQSHYETCREESAVEDVLHNCHISCYGRGSERLWYRRVAELKVKCLISPSFLFALRRRRYGQGRDFTNIFFTILSGFCESPLPMAFFAGVFPSVIALLCKAIRCGAIADVTQTQETPKKTAAYLCQLIPYVVFFYLVRITEQMGIS
jgi:hypothetical protein